MSDAQDRHLSLEDQQLSFDVDPHPMLMGNGFMMGTLKIAGEFAIDKNLQPGTQLMVVVSDVDGQVLTNGLAAITGVTFKTLTEKGVAVGTERGHKAKMA